MKTCSCCRLDKPLEEFNKESSRKDGHQRYCRTCVKERAAKRYSEKREELLAQSREWHLQNRESVLDRKRTNYAKNQAKERSRSLAWKNANLGQANQTARIATIQRDAIPVWADMEAMKAIYQAAAELSRATGARYHVDHIVPIRNEIVCGLHCEANLQVLTHSQNSKKGNRHWPDMPD